jgi:hypothetical protein
MPSQPCTATDHTRCTPALCAVAAAAMFDKLRIGLAQTRADRDRAYRLLDQTRAALRVALHHLKDRPGIADDAAHERRENQLAACRIALKDATEAVEAAGLDSPADHAQGGPDLAPVIAHQWSVRYPDGFVDGTQFTESGARQRAAELGGEVVYRAVGPWQSAPAADGAA